MAVLTIQSCATRSSPGRLMRRIDKLMSSFVESRFEDTGISFVQWIALKVVRDGVARSAGDLARELSITTGATTRMIDVLEARGLMVRDRAGDDRRVVNLAVTEAGQETVEQLMLRVVEAWNEVLKDFDQAEVDLMVMNLMRLLAAVERVSGNTDTLKELAE
jgi:DNA-binding MarR family transcriptional regulator